MTTLRGILPALVTPRTSDGEVDLPGLEQLVDDVILAGVGGVCPLGSTGEYYALSDQQREAVIRATVSAAGGRVPVVAGTNGGGTRAVVEYSRQAARLGASALLLAAPYYSLPTAEELIAHFAAVDAAVGIPIVLYNYPARTGVDMTPDVIERLAELPSVRYIKESTGDLTRLPDIRDRCGDRLTLLCGSDAQALENFSLGAVGWISGAANFAARPCVELHQAAVVDEDDAAARAWYEKLLPLLAFLESGKYTQRVKACCRLFGRDVGDPFPPLLPVDETDVAELVLLCREFKDTSTTPVMD